MPQHPCALLLPTADVLLVARGAHGEGLARVGGSTRHALARGDRLETATLHGYFVHLGAQLGVPTPVNAGLVALAERAWREGWPPGKLGADELREVLGP